MARANLIDLEEILEVELYEELSEAAQELPNVGDALALEIYAELRADEAAAGDTNLARLCDDIASDPRLSGP